MSVPRSFSKHYRSRIKSRFTETSISCSAGVRNSIYTRTWQHSGECTCCECRRLLYKLDLPESKHDIAESAQTRKNILHTNRCSQLVSKRFLQLSKKSSRTSLIHIKADFLNYLWKYTCSDKNNWKDDNSIFTSLILNTLEVTRKMIK